MFVEGFSNWRTIVILAGGATLAIVSIQWSKKKLFSKPFRRLQREKKENAMNEPVKDVLSSEEIIEVVNTSIPELPGKNWVKVGCVKDLYFYPLKSGRGKSLEKCIFSEIGISAGADGSFTLRDRMFLVYNTTTGKCQSARMHPKLLLVSISAVNKNCVKLEAVGTPPLIFNVPIYTAGTSRIAEAVMWFGDKVQFLDCGNEAAKWISSYLTGADSGLRLGSPPTLKNRVLEGNGWSKFMEFYTTMRNSEDTGVYAYLASYMLMTESSLGDLNKRLDKPVSALQFRPNIVISGTEAFSEDSWEWIKIGERTVIRNIKPCTRCMFICHDPQTGVVDKCEPLKTLRTYREVADPEMRAFEHNSPTMGIYCGLYIPGPVNIGDDVFIHKPDN